MGRFFRVIRAKIGSGNQIIADQRFESGLDRQKVGFGQKATPDATLVRDNDELKPG